MFPLQCIPEILYVDSIDTELIIRTDEKDDNGTIDTYSIAVIKKRVINCVQYGLNNQC